MRYVDSTFLCFSLSCKVTATRSILGYREIALVSAGFCRRHHLWCFRTEWNFIHRFPPYRYGRWKYCRRNVSRTESQMQTTECV
jgi:hypothetical protein